MKKTKLTKFSRVAGATLAVAGLAAGMNINTNTYAASEVDFSVELAQSIQIILDDATVALQLTPEAGAPVFTSTDFGVTVATNNMTGYNLTVESDSTDLKRRIANTDGSYPIIQTLNALDGGYTESSFTTNRWGFRVGTTGNYVPFATSNTIKNTDGPSNGDSTDLTFAAKVDMEQDSGTYQLALNFIAVANQLPLSPYIQDYTLARCESEAASAPVTLTDERDGKNYTVRYINDTCWMTQNLAYDLTNVSSLSSKTSNVAATTAIAATDNMGYSYTAPYFHIPTATERKTLSEAEMGYLYNYCATTAGEICSNPSDSTTSMKEATQSICPANWKLPTDTQQSGIVSKSSEFSPVYSGYFDVGSVYSVGSGGYWWSSTAYGEYDRYCLDYNGGSLDTNYYSRGNGYSVRCVLGS